MSKNIAIEAGLRRLPCDSNVSFTCDSIDSIVILEVHQPEKPNPLLNVLGDVAFPLLLIAGLLFLRSRTPGGGGIPGFEALTLALRI